ncbi:MAG: protein translocase subunit SecF [Candidatus Competibacteraceae bacterium]|nr:protein translocase subunit SecF [Candidatus Competibacteraceae bacterium]
MQHQFRQLIKDTHIDFMAKRRTAMIISIVVLVLSILLIAVRGINWGLDFTGGTVVEVVYPAPVDIPDVRAALVAANFTGAEVQHFGTSSDVLIRIAPQEGLNSAEASTGILNALKTINDAVEMQRVEFVGPKVGSELVEQGGLALIFVLILILVYVTLRFEWRLAVGTIVALVHDPVITIGIFALLGVEFDLTVLAAILAVIGYSVNDSVVVLDRIRENFRKIRRGSPTEIINTSINQTLTRTLMTSGTTLLAVLALLFLGGPIIHGFALALVIGIFVGTYSSVYIASSIALSLGLNREDLLPRAKEAADERP